MKWLCLLTAGLLLCLSTPSEARPRASFTCVSGPCYGAEPSAQSRATAASRIGHRSAERTRSVRQQSALREAGRPAGCPSRWCGCYLERYFGKSDRSLWRAREWARFPRAGGPAPGVVAVWPNHVGVVKAVDGGQILLHSGNDGNAVRTRWRSVRGVIAWVRPGGRLAGLDGATQSQ